MGRDDAIPSGLEAPIYVCTRNDDLRAVIDKTPAPQRANLVFLQNGMLDPLLQEYGLQDKATQALVYFAVAKKVGLNSAHVIDILLRTICLQRAFNS